MYSVINPIVRNILPPIQRCRGVHQPLPLLAGQIVLNSIRIEVVWQEGRELRRVIGVQHLSRRLRVVNDFHELSVR